MTNVAHQPHRVSSRPSRPSARPRSRSVPIARRGLSNRTAYSARSGRTPRHAIGRTARRPRTGLSHVVTCLVVLLLTLPIATTHHARAAAPAKKPAEPKVQRTLYVPFDAIPVILSGKNQRVFLTRDEFRRLQQEAKKQKPVKAPIGALLARATYDTSIDDTVAAVQGTIDIEVLQPGLQMVPLDLSGVRLRAAQLDNNPAPIGRDVGGHIMVFVQGVGHHQLKLELQAAVTIAAAQQSLVFQLPQSGSVALRVDVPGNVEVKSGASVVQRTYDSAKDRTHFELVPNRGTTSLVMSLNNRRSRHQRVVVARSVFVSELTTTYERLHATISLDVLHGATDLFTFDVPAGFQVTEVTSPSLSQWVVKQDGKQNVLEVRLREQVRETVALNIMATRAPIQIGSWSMPQLRPRDVAGQVAVVGLLAESRLRPLGFQQKDLIRIDTDVVRSALPESVLKADAHAPQLRPLAAYYAPTGAFTFTASLEDPKDELYVETHLLLSLDRQQQTLRGGFTLTPQGKKYRVLSFHMPDQWVLKSVTDAKQKPLKYERYQAENRKRYVVTLPTAIQPGESRSVYFESTRSSSEWLSEWQTIKVDLPRIQVEQATSSTGAVAIETIGDLTARPAVLEGLRPLDSSQRSRFGLAKARGDLTYQMTEGDYRARFDVRRTKPLLSTRNYAFYKIRPGVLIAHYEVLFDIQRAHARQLSVALPATTPATISIRGMQGLQLKEYTPTVQGEQRIWKVLLATGVEKSAHLAIDFEQRLEDKKQLDLTLPVLRSVGVKYQTHMAAVEGDPALDITVETKMRPIDVGELAEADYMPGPRLLGVFASTAEADQVRVAISLRNLHPLPATIVQRAELVTLVSASGQCQSAARYTLRTKAPLLAVQLPHEAELWSAQLNGKPIKPQRRGDDILLSLQTSSPGQVSDLQIVYQSPVSSIDWIGELATAAPQLRLATDAKDAGVPVPQIDLVWHVHLPAGYRLTRVHGTVFTDQTTRPGLPLAKIGRTLLAMGGGVRSPLLLAARKRAMVAARETASAQRRHYGDAMDMEPSASARFMLKDSGGVDAEAPAEEMDEAAQLEGRSKDDSKPALSVTAGKPAATPAPPAAKKPANKAGMGGMMGGGGMGGGMGKPAGVGGMMGDGRPATAGVAVTPFDRPAATGERAPTGSTAKTKRKSAKGKREGKKSGKYWAMQGLRGLSITIDDSGDAVTLRSLGHNPQLDATLVNATRINWLCWAVALAVLLLGIIYTRRTIVARIRLVGGIILSACVLSIVGGSVTEFVSLLETAVLMAALLVPFWIVVALVTKLLVWVIAKATKVASWATIAGLVLLLAAPTVTPATAQDLSKLIQALEPPVSIPDDAVVVPYDPTDPGGRDKATQVLVPYTRYVELWNLTHPQQKIGTAKQAIGFSTAGAAYQVTLVDDKFLEIDGHLDIVLFADEAVDVPLALRNSVITSALLDKKPARLKAVAPSVLPVTKGKKQVQQQQIEIPPMLTTVVVSGKGMHQLELKIRVPIARQGGWRRIDANIPYSQATAVRVTVPESGTHVTRSIGTTPLSRVTDKAAQTIDSVLGPGGQFQIAWRGQVSPGSVDQALTGKSLALVDLAENGVRVVWQIDFAFGQTERGSFLVSVPEGYLVEKVDGKNVRGWDIRKSPKGSELTVELLKSVKQHEQFIIHLMRRTALAVPKPMSVDIPVVQIPDAALHEGTLRIRQSTILNVTTAGATGVSRADNSSLKKQLAPLMAGTHSPLGMKDYQTFQFHATPFHITTRVNEVPSKVSAQLRTLTRIGETEATLESELRLTTTKRPLYEVHVAIPSDLTLEDVSAQGLSDWSIEKKAGQSVLSVFFSSGRTGVIPIAIRGKLSEHGPESTIELPHLEVLHVARQTGFVVVQADTSLDVRATDLKNCRTILLDQVTGWLASWQRSAARFALAYQSAPYEGKVKLTPRRPRVACDTITNVRLTYREIQETILLDFHISRAGVRSLVFQLPAWLKDADIHAPMIRQKTITDVEKTDRVRVTLQLQDSVMGDYRIVIENDRAIQAGRQLAPIPIVDSGTTTYGYVTLENAGRDEVVVDGVQGLQVVQRQSRPWQFLVDRLKGADFASAYVTTAPDADVQFGYKTHRREMVTTAGASIGLAETELVMDESGTYRGSMQLKVDNRTEPYLEIVLPEDASLWSAHVDGLPVKPALTVPAPNARHLRIPLVKTVEGGLDYPVVLKYGGTIGAIKTLRNVRFPIIQTVNIHIELSHVTLHLPESMKWLKFDGSAVQVEGKDDFLVGYLAYRTRQVEGLTQVLRGKNLFSKTRAAQNVKNLEAELESVQGQFTQGRRGQPNSKELQQNLDFNARAVEVANEELRLQVDRDETVVDNRQRLNDLYEHQKTNLSRNSVTRLGANFALPATQPTSGPTGQPQGGEAKKQSNSFYSAWSRLSRSRVQLGERAKEANQPQQAAGQQAAQQPNASRIGKSAQRRLSQSANAPAADQAAQNVFQYQAKPADKYDVGNKKQRVMSSRSGGAAKTKSQLKRAYSDKLERAAEKEKGLPVRGERLRSSLAAGTSLTPAEPFANRVPSARYRADDATGAMDGAEELAKRATPTPTGLASLDFTLPVRGTTYYFTTPGGDVDLTARPITDGNVSRLKSLACLVVLGLCFWALLFVVRHWPRSFAIKAITAGLLCFIGFWMFVGLILPLYGLAVLFGGILIATRRAS